MGTISTVFYGLCFAVGFCHWGAHRHLLNAQQEKLLAVATSELHVRENGSNEGIRVQSYLNYVGLPKGHPWCAAFVSWVYGQSGYAYPRTAWSPALFTKSKQIKEVAPADVLGIYFANLRRIAHCGLVVSVSHNWVNSIEGNTNLAGSREGDGVYRKRRHIKTIYAFARWWPAERRQR
jgi:hypothetical protein